MGATIYLDFDGTVVEHAYPKIGRAVPHAMRIIELLQKCGHKIILNTMRCEFCKEKRTGDVLEKAIQYIECYPEYEVKLDGVTKEKILCFNEDFSFGKSVLFIDDQVHGVPTTSPVYNGSKMVDWLAVEQLLIQNGILKS